MFSFTIVVNTNSPWFLPWGFLWDGVSWFISDIFVKDRVNQRSSQP